jgi:hypothetical protein
MSLTWAVAFGEPTGAAMALAFHSHRELQGTHRGSRGIDVWEQLPQNDPAPGQDMATDTNPLSGEQRLWGIERPHRYRERRLVYSWASVINGTVSSRPATEMGTERVHLRTRVLGGRIVNSTLRLERRIGRKLARRTPHSSCVSDRRRTAAGRELATGR